MIGNVIDGQLLQLQNYPAAAALSIILMVLILILVGDLRRAQRNGGPAVSLQEAAVLGRIDETPRPLKRPRARRGNWGVGVYSVARLRDPADPDRVHDRVLVQRLPARTNIVLARVHPRQLVNVCDDARVCEAFGNSILVGVVATVLADGARHRDRDRAGALPVPVPHRR